MKQNLFNKLWLRVGMIVAIMTTALSGTAWATDETIDFTAQGYTNAQAVSETSGTVVKATFTDGGTPTAYYDTGTAVRVYNGGTMSVTASGNTITKVVYVYELNGSATASVAGKTNTGTYNSSTKTWTGSDTEVVLTAGTAKHVRISSVTVTYTTGGGSQTTTYSVTYVANGGSGTMTDNNSYEEGDEVTLLANTFTAPSDKVWDSWLVKDASNNTVSVSNNKFNMPASNVTVTAQWVDDPNAPEYEWVETNLSDLTASDIFVIVGNDAYAMASTLVSNTQPSAVSVTISNGKISGSVADNLRWNVSGNSTDGYIFHPNGDETNYLYCNTTASSSNNTNMRIGTQNSNIRNLFVLSNNHLVTNDTYTERYIHLNGSTDWRGYTSSSTNSTTVKFYKRQVVSNDPAISANNVEITYNATSGSIDYSLENATGNVSATVTSGDWLTLGEITSSEVPFTCTANPNNTPREATVTLSFSGADNKVVTVTQAGAPVIYTTIPALFAKATEVGSTATDVNVTFNNWVVSGVSTNGKNVFVTDNSGKGFVIYYGSNMSETFAAGKILSGTAVSCKVQLYKGYAEVTNLDASDLTITTGGTVSVANVAMASLAGDNTGALVHYENLTCSINNNKYYLSDGTTTIQVYNSLFAFEALTSGTKYNITGVYQQFDETKEILPRSAADIEEVVVTTPSIVVADATVNVGAAGVDDGEITVIYNNIATGTAEIVFYTTSEATTVTTEPTWIATDINSSNNVEYVVDENTSTDARTAYMKVKVGDVYSNLITITQAAPMTYVALVAEYNDTYFAVNKSFANKTFSATEVNAVNGKVVNGETDEISWAITENNGKATIVNKDGSTYIGFSGNDLNLQSSEWTIDNNNHSWNSGSNRYFYYRESAHGFRNYSSQNINAEGYSGYTTAYTFADGYTRDVTASNYGTICLPYDVAAEDFSGVKFYKIASKKMSGETLVSVNLEEVTSLSAGCAYIFQANDDATKLIAAYSGEEAATPVAANASVTGLVGTYSRTAIPQGCYVLKDGQIWYVDQANYMFSGANKAYIDLTNVPAGSAGVKQIVLFCGDDDATGLERVQDVQDVQGAIYNLAGQRLNKMQKGINIVNGKKVLK